MHRTACADPGQHCTAGETATLTMMALCMISPSRPYSLAPKACAGGEADSGPGTQGRTSARPLLWSEMRAHTISRSPTVSNLQLPLKLAGKDASAARTSTHPPNQRHSTPELCSTYSLLSRAPTEPASVSMPVLRPSATDSPLTCRQDACTHAPGGQGVGTGQVRCTEGGHRR